MAVNAENFSKERKAVLSGFQKYRFPVSAIGYELTANTLKNSLFFSDRGSPWVTGEFILVYKWIYLNTVRTTLIVFPSIPVGYF
jgi:hypothetical protein